MPRPLFRYRDGHFQVTFFAPEDMLKLKIQGARPVFEIEKDILKGLSGTQKKIIKILMEENETNVPTLSKQLDLALPMIRKAIGILRDKGLVVQRGKARETTYTLNLSQEEA